MFKLLTHWMFPGCCCLCDGSGCDGMDICEVCLNCLPNNLISCSRCASPIIYTGLSEAILCGSCLKEKPRLTQTIAPFIFEYPVDYIVRSLKFQHEEKYARLMGELLAKVVQDSKVTMPECLIPVPLHRLRYLERGFNQAELVAYFCAAQLGLPVANNFLERVQYTVPQTGLGRDLRKKNLRGAFQVTGGNSLPKHVTVIDDVITTGSTVNEISSVLLKRGVERVDVWAFARAVKHGR